MTDSEADRREAAEPPEGRQNREREGPGSEEPVPPQTPPGAGEEDTEEDDEDSRVDRDAEETFPASDPPGNY